MKIKEGYLLREVAGTPVVMPIGNVDFSGMISLNETAKFLWEHLRSETDEAALLAALTEEFEVDAATASTDLKAFLEVLRQHHILAE